MFNRQKLAQQIEAQLGQSHLLLSGTVRYVNRSVREFEQEFAIDMDILESVGREAYADLHIRTHYQRLFFEKMADWRDEAEWRWVVFGNATSDLYIDIATCLAGIMFGENTEEKIIQDIIEQTKSWIFAIMA